MATKQKYLDEMKKVTPSRQTVVDAIAKARARQDNKRTPQKNPSENVRPGRTIQKKPSSLDPEPSTGEVDPRFPLSPVTQATSPSKMFFQNVFASRSEAHPSMMQSHSDHKISETMDTAEASREGRDPNMDTDQKVVADPPADGWPEEVVRDNAPSHSAESLDDPESSEAWGSNDDKKEDGVAYFLRTGGRSEAFKAKKYELQSVAETEECEFGLSSRNLPNSPSMKSDIDSGYDSWELKGMASEETMKATGNARRTTPHKGTFVRKGKKKASDEEKVIKSLFSVDSSVAPVDALFDQGLFDDYDEEEESDEEDFQVDSSEEYSVSTPLEFDIPLERKESTSRHDVVVFDEGDGVEMLETKDIQDEVESALGKDQMIEDAVKTKLRKSKPKVSLPPKTNDIIINIKMNTASSGLDPAGVIQHSLSADSGQKEMKQADVDGAADTYDDFVHDFLRSGSADEGGTAPDDTDTAETTAETYEQDVNQNVDDVGINTTENLVDANRFLKQFATLEVKEKEQPESPEAGRTEIKNESEKKEEVTKSALAVEEREWKMDPADFPDKLQESDGEADELAGDGSSHKSEHKDEFSSQKIDTGSNLEQPSDEDSKVSESHSDHSGSVNELRGKDSKESKKEQAVEITEFNLPQKPVAADENNAPEPLRIFTFEKGMSRKTWHRRNEMATEWQSNKTWLSPKTLNGVSAAKNLGFFANTSKEQEPRPWKLPYKERTRNHHGFKDVDVYSVRESTAVLISTNPKEDVIPWERRDVKQLFLQERSVEFARNWFGENLRMRGNEKYKPPICKPKSMEMPISSAPDPEQWTEDIYTTWKSPYQKFEQEHLKIIKSDDENEKAKDLAKGPVQDDGSFSNADSQVDGEAGYSDEESFTDSEGSYNDEGSYSGSEGYDDETEASWEDAPECGEIINMRLKIGEHITRVHPDYTSSLRRSRWRQKYFPKGTFPY